MNKPLVRAMIFVRRQRCYAFFDENGEGDDVSTAHWQWVPMPSCRFHSSEWYKAAFEGCVQAYRMLQQQHPEKDIVLSADDIDLGELPYYRRMAKDGES